MEQAAKAHSPQALEAWRTANAFWKQGAERFNNKLLRSIVTKLQTQPATLGKSLHGANYVDGIIAIRNAVGANRPLWQKIQNSYMLELLEQARDPVTKQFSGVKMQQAIKREAKNIAEIFPEFGVLPELLKQFGEVAALIQAKSKDQIGKAAIQFIQAGAVVGAFTGHPGKAAAVVLTPLVLAQIFTRPIALKLFTTLGKQEVVTQAGKAKAGELTVKLLALMAREEILPSQQQEAEQGEPQTIGLLPGFQP